MNDLKMTIERELRIEDIKIDPYRPQTFDSPAEGGNCEGFKAFWVDIHVVNGEKKSFSTELTPTEYDTYSDEIMDYVDENIDEVLGEI